MPRPRETNGNLPEHIGPAGIPTYQETIKMTRSIALLLIGLIFGGGIGFVVAASNGVTLDGHDHDAHDDHGTGMSQTMEHSHDEMLTLTTDVAAPTLDIEVLKDPSAGWNLHVMTENFRFAPEHASLAHVAGEGHAHVYVNGTKIGRLYGNWMHIAELPKGEAKVEVTLNSNDHLLLANGDTPLSVTKSVQSE